MLIFHSLLSNHIVYHYEYTQYPYIKTIFIYSGIESACILKLIIENIFQN